MNKRIYAIAAFMLPMMAIAQSNTGLLHISGVSVNKGDSLVTLNMNVDTRAFKVKGNDIVTLTPKLVADGDTVAMPGIRIAGRNAWYSEIREGRSGAQAPARAGKGLPVEYSGTVAYSPATGTSTIIVTSDTVSICNCDPARSGDRPIVEINEPPVPDFLGSFSYVAPKDTADKVFNLSGRANIIFKVNRTDIDWSYYSNHAELDSILKSVRAVKDNEYATVDTILLTGYASPEGPYANNVRLAKGRTEAVQRYVESNSSFPHSVYHTASVPEDWGGLREWLTSSSMPARDAMIAFIDDPDVPVEKKNDIFRARFPQEYPYLLKNVYPTLRHTDYRIRYRIKKFYDLGEIARVFEKNPRMLSLNELYLLAGTYGQGSPEYYKVFMTAAAMYPDSDVANLNAAGCSMESGNLQAARTYLEKVRPDAGSYYAWGVLHAMEGDYPKALEMLRKAAAAGFNKASDMIPQVEAAMHPKDTIVVY